MELRMQRTPGKDEIKDARVEAAALTTSTSETAKAIREAAEAIRQLAIAINNQTLAMLDNGEDEGSSAYDLSGKRIA